MSRHHATAVALIGAGYGDEGKGLLTDSLGHMFGGDAVVIRFNGGGQAGHTVTLPDGRRHVFHHVGSASFSGAATALSRHFISNPRVLADELAALAQIGVYPRIIADERGLLTTPWDMMINQFMEEARGGARHGSCGLGIGETVERNLHPAYATTLGDLRGDLDALRQTFQRIRHEWVPKRLTQLDQPGAWLRNRDLILSDDGMEEALGGAAAMLSSVDLVPELTFGAQTPLIFEGAQGLLLDQTMGAFPHVTRSNTGMANVVDIARSIGITDLQAIYATRAYVTRHGAGPLAHQQAGPPSPLFSDPTNQPNPWQGRLRFGHLDIDILEHAIHADLVSVAETKGCLRIKPRLAVTCLDQIETSGATWVEAGKTVEGTGRAMLDRLIERNPAWDEPVESYGPTREALVNLTQTMASLPE